MLAVFLCLLPVAASQSRGLVARQFVAGLLSARLSGLSTTRWLSSARRHRAACRLGAGRFKAAEDPLLNPWAALVATTRRYYWQDSLREGVSASSARRAMGGRLDAVQFHVLLAMPPWPRSDSTTRRLPLSHAGSFRPLDHACDTSAPLLIAEKRGFSRLLPVFAAAAMGFAVTASQLRFPPYAFETSFPFLHYLGILGGYLDSIHRAAAHSSPSRERG